jgi:hypothetical protein
MGIIVLFFPVVGLMLLFDYIIQLIGRRFQFYRDVIFQTLFSMLFVVCFMTISTYVEKLYYYEWNFSEVHFQFSNKDFWPLIILMAWAAFGGTIYHFVVFRPLNKNKY